MAGTILSLYSFNYKMKKPLKKNYEKKKPLKNFKIFILIFEKF
jgi:hypothetical protein